MALTERWLPVGLTLADGLQVATSLLHARQMFGWFTRLFSRAGSSDGDLAEMKKSLVRQLEEFADGEINPIEAALVMDRTTVGPEGMRRLYQALARQPVAVLVHPEAAVFAPLTVRHPKGFRLLVVFTREVKAEAILEKSRNNPDDFNTIKFVSFLQVLDRLQPGEGLSINPMDLAVRLDFSPDEIAGLRKNIEAVLRPQSSSAPEPPPLPTPPRPRAGEGGYHATEELTPETELEQMLSDARAEKVSISEAVDCFLRSDVFILDTEFNPDKPHQLHAPLMQYGPRDEPLVAMFTSPKRAEPSRVRRPEFRYLKETKAADVVLALSPLSGLVLNPGWKVGLQIPPRDIGQLRTAIEQKRKMADVLAEKSASGAPSHFDQPRNLLEEMILAFHHRQVGLQQFLECFFNAQVVVLSNHEQFDFKGAQAVLRTNPQLFTVEGPQIRFVGIFSDPSRATPAFGQQPEFRFAVQVTGGDLLLSLDPSLGIAINPGWDINFHWDPAQVDTIRKTLRE